MGGWREKSGGAGLWICIYFMRIRIQQFFLLMRILIGSGYWNLDPYSGWPNLSRIEKNLSFLESQKIVKDKKTAELERFT